MGHNSCMSLHRRPMKELFQESGSSEIYAPTTAHEVSKIVREIKTQFTVVMGDFNSKLGKKRDGLETPLGPYGFELRNDKEEKLINITLNNNLKIANTFFKKRDGRRWTWESPDRKTQNEIDFIVTDKLNIIKDISTMNKIDVGSDHRFLKATVELDAKLERKKSMNRNINYNNLKQNKEKFQLQI
ncbi:craniofacial development protein 2-like [Penaeus vannamei]|uniref:craniofacial development protein 2-like n=1 Tax=Penaeus vannamei TaxID=6689 RepID=UPI00387F7308